MMTIELLDCKELACALKRSVRYVYAMRQRGFKMPGNRTTITAALDWLGSNPPPTRKMNQPSNRL